MKPLCFRTHSVRFYASLLSLVLVLAGLVLPFGPVPAARAAEEGMQPFLVKDTNPQVDPQGSDPWGGIIVGNIRYFNAREADHGYELWRTDGTDAGTWMVKDINPGPANGAAKSYYTQYNGLLLFTAYDADHGQELWRSDGTAAGTWLLKDINPGPGNTYLNLGYAVNGKYIFSACEPVHGCELWTTDGTTEGTSMIVDAVPGADQLFIESIQVLGNKLIFGRVQPSDMASGFTGAIELWQSDGTPQGTLRFFGPVAPYNSASTAVYRMFPFNNKLYFVMDTADNGRMVWSTDGTAQGTEMVNLPSGLPPMDTESNLKPEGTDLYFTTTGVIPSRPLFLWRLPAGTNLAVLVQEFYPSLNQTVGVGSLYGLLNRQFLFSGHLNGSTGTRLWKTDGTTANTSEVCPGCKYELTSPGGAKIWAGKLYFTAKSTDLSSGHGEEVWVSDGTAAGTYELADINVGAASSAPYYFTPAGNLLYFSANDGVHDNELWAIQQPAALSANFSSGAPNSYFAFSASGFTPSSKVLLSLAGSSINREIGSAVVDENGAFSFTLNSLGAAPGVYTVTATSDGTGTAISRGPLSMATPLTATFQVTIDASQPARPKTGTDPEVTIIPLQYVFLSLINK